MQLLKFHCHVYFQLDETERAEALLGKIESAFGFRRGRFHTNPIGPHIGGSCQVRFEQADFGSFVPWLMANRDGLTCFIHGLTGDDIIDHSDYVLWLGKEWPLNMGALSSPSK